MSQRRQRKARHSFKETIGVNETVRHLIPRIKVEIDDLEPSFEAEDVEEAVRGFFELWIGVGT